MGVDSRRKEKEDRNQSRHYFRLLGWHEECEEDQMSDSRLTALLARARAYKKEMEVWKEKNRCVDKMATFLLGIDLVLVITKREVMNSCLSLGLHFKSVILWFTIRDHPKQNLADEPDLGIKWDQHPWASDTLWPMMESEMQRVKKSLESGESVSSAKAGEAVPTAAMGGPMDYLTYTVKLLAGIRWDTLDTLDAAVDGTKRLAVYRGIRTQKFLEFTEQKIREREAGLREVRERLSVYTVPVILNFI